MKRPSIDECWNIIRERAIQVATIIMARRGMTYRTAQSVDEVNKILSGEFARLLTESDLLTAAALLMQAHRFYDEDDELGKQAKLYAKWMEKQAEDAFYDHGDPDSMMFHQLAAGLDPQNAQILWEVMAPCLQNSPMRPREALPCAILVAHLNPQRDEVEYVERLIYQEELSEQAQHGSEWLTAAGNNRRTGAFETIIKPPLRMVWRSEEVVNPKGGIVVSNSIAVCGTGRRGSLDSHIYAVDVMDGSKMWGYPMHGIVVGTPVINGDYVYIGCSSLAICLDLATGHEVWKTEQNESLSDGFPVAMAGCPLCVGRLVVYRDDNIRGFDALTGEELFSVGGSSDPRGNAGPCSDDKSLYLPGTREIMRVDLEGFEVKANAYTNGKINAGPILADDLLVYCSNRGFVEALDAQSLEAIWSFEIEDPHLNSIGMDSACAYANGMLFVGGIDGNLYGLEARTGTRVWKYQTGESVDMSPIVCGDIVFLNAEGKGLCGLDMLTGNVLCEEQFWEGEFQMGTAGLAVSDSILLAGSDRLCAFVSEDAT